jgi:hypothetical protein
MHVKLRAADKYQLVKDSGACVWEEPRHNSATVQLSRVTLLGWGGRKSLHHSSQLQKSIEMNPFCAAAACKRGSLAPSFLSLLSLSLSLGSLVLELSNLAPSFLSLSSLSLSLGSLVLELSNLAPSFLSLSLSLWSLVLELSNLAPSFLSLSLYGAWFWSCLIWPPVFSLSLSLSL